MVLLNMSCIYMKCMLKSIQAVREAFRQTNNEILFALHQRARRLSPGFLVPTTVLSHDNSD